MKRLLILLSILLVGLFSTAQSPYTGLTGYAVKQSLGSDSAIVNVKGALSGRMVIYNFADTTTANTQRIKNYPGALIFTTDSSKLWLRNKFASAWGGLASSSGTTIVSIDIFSDSSWIICYSDGSCDTIGVDNFTEIINNIIQNFNDSTIYNLNDSTLIICNAAGSCDTINLGNSFTYYFINDSTLVTCDTLETICIGDSCYQQQLCDTIPVPALIRLQFQNGHYQLAGTNIVEAYDVGGNQAQLLHNSFLNTYAYNLTFTGQPVSYEPFSVKQGQIVNLSSSVTSFHHVGGNKYSYPGMIDNDNEVRLYVNYTDRFFTGVSAPFTGDTIGFMYDRIGYMLMGNSRGNSTRYELDNIVSKQNGLMIHTLDTQYTDAVTIFGNQTPQYYAFSVNPYPTTTLLDSRIAVFKTTGQVQLPQYIEGAFEEPSPLYIIAQDSEGNLVQYPPGGVSTGLLIDADNGLSVRSATTAVLGQNEAEVGNPAILLNNREIPAGGFYISFNASATQAVNILQTKNAAAAVRARVTDDASFSNTGGQANSEIFGDDVSTTGTNTVVIGNSAAATGNEEVVIGYDAAGGGVGQTVVIGSIASSTVGGSVVIGSGASATTLSSATIIGQNATSAGGGSGVGYAINLAGAFSSGLGNQVNVAHTFSVGIGTLATTTLANQIVFGSTGTGEGINHYYFGNGVTTAAVSLADVDFNPTGASGTDVAGINFYINGAKRTGNSTTGGDIRFQTSDAGASGTTLQSLTTKAILSNSVFGIGITSSFTATRLNVVDNSLAGANMVDLTSTSTGAASNAQKMLNISLSGANSTNTQTTYGAYISNTHSGTGNTNYAIYATISNEISGSAAIRANASGGYGVLGESSTSYGTYGLSGSGIGAVGGSTSSYGGSFFNNPSSTNSVVGVLLVTRNTSGSASNGIGAGIDISVQNSLTSSIANSLQSTWTDATFATRTSKLVFTGVTSSATETWLTIGQSGYVQFRGMNVTEAGALTAADGMIIYVTNTDATFTSVGFWGREAGAWVKL